MVLITTKHIKPGEVLAYPVGSLAVTLVGRHGVAHLHSPVMPLGAEADGNVINSVVLRAAPVRRRDRAIGQGAARAVTRPIVDSGRAAAWCRRCKRLAIAYLEKWS